MKRLIPLLLLASILATSCSQIPDPSDDGTPLKSSPGIVSTSPSTQVSVPTTTQSTPHEIARDWIKELVALGYIAGEDSDQWLDERMIDDAAKFCLTSVSNYGDGRVAKAYKQTEFEHAVMGRSAAADPTMEFKYVKKVLERFCKDRLEALKTVIRMHPEINVPVSEF